MARIKKAPLRPVPSLESPGRAYEIRSVNLPTFLVQAVAADMERHGYGPRSRSTWLEEAIAGLILHDPSLLIGSSGSRAYSPDAPEARLQQIKVNLRTELGQQAKWLVRSLRRQHPDGEGTFTDVLRYAVIFRCRYPHHFPNPGTNVHPDALIEAATKVVLDPVLAQPYPTLSSTDA